MKICVKWRDKHEQEPDRRCQLKNKKGKKGERMTGEGNYRIKVVRIAPAWKSNSKDVEWPNRSTGQTFFACQGNQVKFKIKCHHGIKAFNKQ